MINAEYELSEKERKEIAQTVLDAVDELETRCEKNIENDKGKVKGNP
jgi:hypothetical protein